MVCSYVVGLLITKSFKDEAFGAPEWQCELLGGIG